MEFNLPFGIRIADNSPIDGDRYVVQTLTQRDALITTGRAYNGLQVYVESNETLYILKGSTVSDWETLLNTNLFNSDGSIPINTNRVISIGNNSDLEITNGNLSVFFQPDTFSIDASEWALTTDDGFTNISASDASALSIRGFYGVQMVLGTLGTVQTPSVGQVLSAADTQGTLAWVSPTSGSSTGLEAIDEGNGIGWRLIGKDPTFYGNIGLNSVDLSDSTSISTTRGVTSNNSIAVGENISINTEYSGAFGRNNNIDIDNIGGGNFILGRDNVIQGTNGLDNTILGRSNLILNGSNNVVLGSTGGIFNASNALVFGSNSSSQGGMIALGNNADALAVYSIAIGYDINTNGNDSVAIGRGLTTYAEREVMLGGHATEESGGTADDFVLSDRAFVVGIGDLQIGSGPIGRRDGISIYKSGEVFFPELTNTLIDNSLTDDIAITRGWINAQGFGAGNNLYTSDGNIPTTITRTVTINTDSELVFEGVSSNTSFTIGDDFVELSSADLSLENNNGDGLQASDGNPTRVIGSDGVQIELGTGGTATPPAVGQVLTAIDTQGTLTWTTLSGSELLTSSSISSSRNILGTDADGLNVSTSATDVTITVVDNTTVSLPIGTLLSYKRNGTGNIIIVGDSGVTMPSYQTHKLDDVITIRKIATDTWEFINPPRVLDSQISGEITGSSQVLNIVTLTQAEYDLGTPVTGTFYLIQ